MYYWSLPLAPGPKSARADLSREGDANGSARHAPEPTLTPTGPESHQPDEQPGFTRADQFQLPAARATICRGKLFRSQARNSAATPHASAVAWHRNSDSRLLAASSGQWARATAHVEPPSFSSRRNAVSARRHVWLDNPEKSRCKKEESEPIFTITPQRPYEALSSAE